MTEKDDLYSCFLQCTLGYEVGGGMPECKYDASTTTATIAASTSLSP